MLSEGILDQPTKPGTTTAPNSPQHSAPGGVAEAVQPIEGTGEAKKPDLLFSVGIPLTILLASLVTAYFFFANRPVAKQNPNRLEAPLEIKTTQLKPQDYPIVIRSYGVVEPRSEATLIPQVSGMIVSVSENFREGGSFQKGEVLIRIDDRDYRNALTVAQAAFTQAEFQLKEEQARSDQAQINWQRLGKKGSASELVLRLPQLSVAKAALASAGAQLNQAQLNLERTRIIAPYSGRVLSKQADVGQVVSPGFVLAAIYATDVLEVRLPINNQQLQFLPIPDAYSTELSTASQTSNELSPPKFEAKANAQTLPRPHYPKVTFYSATNPTMQWQGEVVRSEGAIDIKSRQLFVIAQINPSHQQEHGSFPPPLKIGQFITGEIQSTTLPNVFVIPRANLYKGNTIWVVEDSKLTKKTVIPLWKNDDIVLVRDGVSENAQLVTTPLLSAITGRKVSVIQ